MPRRYATRELGFGSLFEFRRAVFDAAERYSQARRRPLPVNVWDIYVYLQEMALDVGWNDTEGRNLADALTDDEAHRKEGALEGAYDEWLRNRRRRAEREAKELSE